MNLRQAYDGWAQQEQNRALYMKTRDAFRRAWFTLPTNKPCSWYTADRLALALAETNVIESDKVKSASVMVHVLTWANFAEPKWNPKPTFKLEDVTRLIRLPADELEKERERIVKELDAFPVQENEDNVSDSKENVSDSSTDVSDSKENVSDLTPEKPMSETKKKPNHAAECKAVYQIEPNSMQVINRFDSISQAQRETKANNITRAIQKRTMAGGYYWCMEVDKDTFQPAERKGKSGRPSKAQPELIGTATIEPAPQLPSNLVPSDALDDATRQPAEPQKNDAARQALAVFSDDELLEELDRRGWTGELQKHLVVTIGKE